VKKYPVGIQTFERIVKEGFVYIDKTDLVWKLTKVSPFVFLSRPRRFGKSLLSSTLHSYFEGKKELFEGLKIMQLELEWEHYPVIHIDLSATKHLPIQQVREELFLQLSLLERTYGSSELETSPGMKLSGIIRRAYEQTGKQVAIIIDEYDAPLLDNLQDETQLQETREVLQEFYQRLKMLDPYIKFCFITGITKFSQLSIFSTLNNLTNVTLQPEFSAICGITEQELATDMKQDIAMLAEEYGCTPEEMHAKLKQRYDGYHFSEKSPDIYNPFSLLKAFMQKKIDNYWFESGTPTFLIQQMCHYKTDITNTDDILAFASDFDRPTEAMISALPLLYQCGYLTIKDYDRETETYRLSLPNQEVRIGYSEGLMPVYLGIDSSNVKTGFAMKFWQALKKEDINLALHEMQSYFASLPYIEGFKKKMGDITKAEGFYEWTFNLIFSMLNIYVCTQVKTIKGRTDMVVWMPNTIYVFELKINDSAANALQQIEDKGYAIPYQTDGRKVIKVGIHFSTETLNIEDWEIGGRAH
jgi:hypothetical protein